MNITAGIESNFDAQAAVLAGTFVACLLITAIFVACVFNMLPSVDCGGSSSCGCCRGGCDTDDWACCLVIKLCWLRCCPRSCGFCDYRVWLRQNIEAAAKEQLVPVDEEKEEKSP